MTSFRSLFKWFAPLFLTGLAVGAGEARQNLEIRWDKYHTYEEVTEVANYLAEAFPGLAGLESAGKTTMKQRDIWVLTLTNRETGKPEDKPGFFLDGGTHAGEFGGSETALYTAWYLVTHYGQEPEVTEFLDTRTLYVMPRKDSDGMEVRLTGELDYDPAQVPFPIDTDHDGRFGEDGPADINGDGEVLQMRIQDPDGGWIASPEDGRIMKRRQDGDSGPFYRLMTEGKDEDGDGEVNEDPPVTGFSSNRNYPGRWSNPLSTQRGRGQYPAQEPETRATVDFVYAHPNIGGMQSLHHYAGVILRPFSNLSQESFPLQDLTYYDAIAQRGREITDYGYIDVYEDFTGDKDNPRYGVQLDWGYLDVGVITYSTEQWRYTGNIGPTGEWWDATPEEQMATNDTRFGGKHFVNWKSFDHPTLGDLEIGGWIQFSVRNPPPDIMEEEMLVPNMRFILYHASTTPLVRVAELEVITVKGAHRVEATIANEGFLPTYVTAQALRSKGVGRGQIAEPVVATIEVGDGVTLVSSRSRVEVGHIEGTPPVVKQYSFGSKTFGGNNEQKVEWVVTGSGEITVEASSEKGGKHSRKIHVGGS
jgi:hypothetical protein